MRPSIDGWQTCLDPDGGTPYLEHRAGHEVITFRPGAPVAVSLDYGHTWHLGTLPVRSIYNATIAADVILRRLRAERATRATPRGLAASERLEDRCHVPQGARGAERRCPPQRAELGAPQVRRAPRAGKGEGATGVTLRAGDAPAPRWVTFDHPVAIRLAHRHVASLRPSVEGENGRGDFFAVAVAIVRGFCLLPETAAAEVLAPYAARCLPPWKPTDQRRALLNAQRIGSLPWGVLLSRSAEGRALWTSWRDAFSAPRGGRGAGKGGRHG